MALPTGDRRASARGWSTSRYPIFIGLVLASALTPGLPHGWRPATAWWAVSWGLIALMLATGWLGARRRPTHWLNTAAPLMLLPVLHALRCADGNWRSGFAALILLPVVWFALYGRQRDVVLAVVGGAVTLCLPILVVGAPQYPESSWRGALLLVVISAALGPLIYRLVDDSRRANRALRHSELEFRAAFEDAPVGMAITGLTGAEAHRFVRVNRALCELFGRSPAELVGQAVADFTHPEDVEATSLRFDDAAAQDAHRVEKRYVHKSGRTILAQLSYSVIHDEQGRPSHFVCQIEDVGARRESDRALLEAYEADREATERLKRLDRMRAEMASTVSHELRTPLTSASGYVELLLEGDAGPLTGEQRSMLATVARSLGRLEGIVSDVLGMARRDPDEPEPRKFVELAPVVAAAVSSVALQAAARGQDLITQVDLDGAWVAGDAGRLERAIVNLLTNALKFTAEDGTITVSALADGDTARVSVADTGIGISAEEQDRIFERFYRAEQSTSAPTPGTGLGLAIVSSIVAQYGGTIAVDSEVGKGSTFTINLPLAR